ncbi:MAG: hypothetical protein GSR86_06660 [Desulfurococcales archaeon]|nr:hypothetical protein [Desulfurococcales archaeon]
MRRRGQAVAVSVAIMTALTLTLGLILYSYFTSHYSREALQSRIEVAKTRIAGSIDLAVTYISKASVSNVNYTCVTVKLLNMGDEPYLIDLTVLPLEETPTSVTINQYIQWLPVDQHTGGVNVYLFIINDTDQDGLVEVVGASNQYEASILSDCGNIVGILHDSLSRIDVDAGNIVINDFRLSELADSQGVHVIRPIPFWGFRLDPVDPVHILVVVEEQPGYGAGYLSLFTRYNDMEVYVASAKIP